HRRRRRDLSGPRRRGQSRRTAPARHDRLRPRTHRAGLAARAHGAWAGALAAASFLEGAPVIQSHAPVSAFLFLAACAAAGCTDSEATPDVRPEDPAVPTVVVESVTVDVPLSLPAQLHVEKDALVHARSEGVVEWLGADLGTRVAQGQLLARLESADQEIAAARAEEVHAVALRDARRQRELTLSGVSTPADSELVESALRRAELDLRQARRNLELTRVTAPFAGIVSARYARAGRLAAAGDS